MISDAGGHDAKLIIAGTGKTGAPYIEQLVQAMREQVKRLELLNDRGRSNSCLAGYALLRRTTIL
jgi:hypothetical protein